MCIAMLSRVCVRLYMWVHILLCSYICLSCVSVCIHMCLPVCTCTFVRVAIIHNS